MATTSQQLAKGAHCSAAAQSPLPNYARGFESVFAKEEFDILLDYHHWDHAIEITPGSKLKVSKVYPLSPKEQAELDTFLKENLQTSCICPSKSPIAAPVFFIKKKNSTLQLVQDYRALNAMMVKNKYPLPLISELIT